MASVGGRPFLDLLLSDLRSQGVERAILCTGYLGDTVRKYFGNGARLGMELVYSAESQPLGTGGAARAALNHFEAPRALILNGDTWSSVQVARLRDAHTSRRGKATLWAVHVDDCSRYGAMHIDGTGAVTRFEEKPAQPRPGLINAGAVVVERDVLDALPYSRFISLERDVLPRLVGRGLFAVIAPEKALFVDIGTPKHYRMAQRLLAAR